jgi:hypothetical protein
MASEWFAVEYENGNPVQTALGNWPNRETADGWAAEAAQSTDKPIFVVRYDREVVGKATRLVTVTTEDLATKTVATVSTTPSDVA